jgi:hypothetical protein
LISQRLITERLTHGGNALLSEDEHHNITLLPPREAEHGMHV